MAACDAEDEQVLVSAGWLAERLGAPDLKIVDGSWHMPAANRDAEAEFRTAHIPGAVFLDIDAVSDHATGLPHMLPAPADFEAAVGALGISNADQVVVYDTAGIFSAPRVWWMFRAMGHDNVAVLDGGLPAWQAEDRPVETGDANPAPAAFTARPRPELVTDLDALRTTLADGTARVLDARPAPRFDGKAPEPRPGLRSGHMPGAANIPFTDVLSGNRLAPPDALEDIFKAKGVTPGTSAVTTCGSGVTAAILSLALARIGLGPSSLYDGSWAEWGGRDDTPVEP